MKNTMKNVVKRIVKKLVPTLFIPVVVLTALLFVAGCGGSDNAGDIETWLVEVGNDFPDEAKCVASAMKSYSVSDFEKSFDGERNDKFENELDAAYAKCDAELGITTEE